ncbi:MAG: hypothetical protein IJV31_06440 [Clostridia bacterium]|nr:hypothetical protein [Clostridia bacterium]MBR1718290.1 hypothetical protein [Bacilli bacterium]
MKYLNGYTWKDLDGKQLMSIEENGQVCRYIGECKNGKLLYNSEYAILAWQVSMRSDNISKTSLLPTENVIYFHDIYSEMNKDNSIKLLEKVNHEIRRELKWLYIKQQWEDRNALQL